MKDKNWDEFWGEFLQVRFHQGNPELWPSRERKALWSQKHFQIKDGAKILDLGCGDGLIDIWLSRMGFDVTAVDRNRTVLDLAKQSDDTKKTNFICSDLKDVRFESQSFDAIFLIETIGLMSKEDDKNLIENCYSWLKQGGKIIIDCPEAMEMKNSWSKDFPEGTIFGNSSFDEDSRLQNIQFSFKPSSGEEFGLKDSYNEANGDKSGILRYLYPKNEIFQMVESIGLIVHEIEHYYPKNYFSILAEKH